MLELGPAAGVKDEQELKRLLEDPLKRVLLEDVDRPIESSRLAQILLAKRNYLYWQGKQYLSPKLNAEGGTIDWQDVTATSQGKKVKFASVYNIIYGDGIKFVSLVSQRKPNQKAVPDDPGNSEQAQWAKDANAGVQYLHRYWKIRQRMKEIAFHIWTTGPVFGYPHYVADGARHGFTEEPIIDTEKQIVSPEGYRCPECGMVAMGEQCPQCGAPLSPMDYVAAQEADMPVFQGTQKYPRGAVELELLSVFHVSVFPLRSKSIEGDTDVLTYNSMISKSSAKMRFEELAELEDLDDGSEEPAQTAAKEALEEIESPDGTQQKDTKQVLQQQRWIRPTVYHAFPKSSRDLLFENFPQGMKVTWIGDKLVEVAAEKMEDHWSVCKTGTGEHINSAPLCQVLIPVQDDTNDMVNMAKETVLRGIPKTIIDGSLLSDEEIERSPLVAEIIRTKMQGNQDISKMIGQLPMSKFSDQMMPLMSGIRETGREIGGIQPSLYGGGEAASTWRAESQRKNQALMQLQPAFDEMQQFVSGVSENGVKELARYGTEIVSIPPPDGSAFEESYVLNMAALQEDGWHVEAEESVPMSFGERSNRIAEISMENPNMAAALGFTHPMNADVMYSMFGVEGMFQPGRFERAKARKTIQRLLEEAPLQTPDPMWMPTGMPGEMPPMIEQPSVMPDEFEDKDHQFVADVFRAWCNSPEGLRARDEKPEGYRNVVLHGQAQEQMAAMAMMPPPGPPGPPAAGGGPPSKPETNIPPVTDSPAPPEPPAP